MKKLTLPLKWTSLVVAFVSVLFLNSCKKDESPKSAIENAKAWYTTATKSQASLKSKGQTITVTKDVRWEYAKLISSEDGSELIAVPMSVTNSNGSKPKGSYMVVITRQSGLYEAMVIYDSKEEMLTKDISTEDLKAQYRKSIEDNRRHARNNEEYANVSKGGGRLANIKEPVCNDYYWVEIIYDGEGNVLFYDEWYLFTNCSTPGEGDGGGSTPSEDQLAISYIMEETKPENTSADLETSFLGTFANGEERKEAYKWKIAFNRLSGYIVWSHETGTHKKVGPNWDDWNWKALDHNSFSVTGKPSYMTVTVTENGPAIPTLGLTVAGISVRCNIEASVIYKGSPWGYPSVDFEKNSPVFYIHP